MCFRSKKELERLHQLYKPTRAEGIKNDDLPSLNSSDEEYSDMEWSQFDGPSSEESEGVPSPEDNEGASEVESDSDVEMPYEQEPRKRRPSWDEIDTRTKQIKGLPTKLPDGTIKKSAKILVMSDSELSSDEESEEEFTPGVPETRVEDVTTGARFGRAAVVDIIGKSSRRERIEAAKEQIATICQEILAEPENSVCELYLCKISLLIFNIAWSSKAVAYILLTRDLNADSIQTDSQ